jgi:hypothetical protein
MSIAAANDQLDTERDRARQSRRHRRQIEDARLELDRLVELVEEVNVGRQPALGSEFLPRLRRLARSLASPPPAQLWRAQTPAAYHAALMDWQERILDRIAPQRMQYADRGD